MFTNTRLPWLLWCLVSYLPPSLHGALDFDTEIRPLFEKRCVECHGPKKQKGELRLDAKSFALKGGLNGQVLQPGKADESAIYLRLISQDEKERMPAQGKPLTQSEIAKIKQWIDTGAVWPENAADLAATQDKRLQHWSVQSLNRNFPPTASLDSLVRESLAKHSLALSPEADRRTLIRRLSFDLLGLPPSPEQVAAFVTDPDPKAYEKLVDVLLASPHYGERWARHWLDIAHYADTHGFERDKLRPNAWRYRDYVITALNTDKPYDQFLREQIAGDVLSPNDESALIATGFLAAGPWDFVGHVETTSAALKRSALAGDLDDILTQVVTASMGITINCARCHDHKLDPITQREYYALKAVFAGVNRGDRVIDIERTRLQQQLGKVEAELSGLLEKGLDLADIVGGGNGLGTGSLKAGLDVITGSFGTSAQSFLKTETPNILRSPILQNGAAPMPFIKGVFLPKGAKNPKEVSGLQLAADVVITDFPVTSGQSWDRIRNGKVSAQPEARVGDIDYLTSGHSVLGLSSNSGITFDLNAIRTANHWGPLRLTTAIGFGSRELDSTSFADFSVYLDSERKLYRPKMTKTESLFFVLEIQDSVRFLTFVATDGGDGIGMDQLFLGDARLLGDAAVSQDAQTQQRYASLKAESQGLQKALAEMKELPAVYAFNSTTLPKPTRVQRRGNPEDEGEDVSPGAFKWASHMPADFGDDAMPEGKRRAALAQWITHPGNPLTWRVLANRLWHHHFGQGLVNTPSDFGLGGDRPSHPELLDWLTTQFLKGGYSLKHLHKLIVTSATYRQSSNQSNPLAREKDSSNRLLWRQNPRRLEAEALRDYVLSIAGTLNPQAGGPGFKDFEYKEAYAPIYQYIPPNTPELRKRSIYRFVVRTTPHQFLSTMDCPDPANLTPARIQTTTALQALSLSNNEFVLQQARQLATRLENETSGHAEAIKRAFQLAFQRNPETTELEASKALVTDHGLFAFCRMILNMNEFIYLD